MIADKYFENIKMINSIQRMLGHYSKEKGSSNKSDLKSEADELKKIVDPQENDDLEETPDGIKDLSVKNNDKDSEKDWMVEEKDSEEEEVKSFHDYEAVGKDPASSTEGYEEYLDIEGLNSYDQEKINEIIKYREIYSKSEIEEELEALIANTPSDWRPREQVGSLYLNLMNDKGDNVDVNSALSVFFGVDKEYVALSRTAISPLSFLYNQTFKSMFPDEYYKYTKDVYSTIDESVDARDKELFFTKFVRHVGGENKLSENLLQIGTKGGYDKTIKHDGGTVELNDSSAFDARANIIGALLLSSKDMALYYLGFGDDESKTIMSKELQKIQWPLKNHFNISSGFKNRYHPIKKKWAFHYGLDIAAPKGTEVMPIIKGTVKLTSKTYGGCGQTVIVVHDKGYTTKYCHLSKILVSSGDAVDLDTVIGLVGSTGASTGNHLHLEVIKDGKHINPMLIIGKLK